MCNINDKNSHTCHTAASLFYDVYPVALLAVQPGHIEHCYLRKLVLGSILDGVGSLMSSEVTGNWLPGGNLMVL